MRYLFPLLLLVPFLSEAQTGGRAVFSFLNLTPPARIAALGGNSIATRDDDITLASQNPALLSKSMDQQVSLSYVGYVDGIRYGNVMAGKHLDKWGTFAFNFHYISYGEFEQTNENSEQTGTFTAGEYAFNLGWGKALDSSFFIGANVKGILSDFAGNQSSGVAADIAANYFNKESLFSASLVIRNIGRQLRTYEGAEREKIPFEIQVALAQQLAKAPFRFSIVMQQLQRWDLTYEDPASSGIDPLTGESSADEDNFSDKFLRHLILNVEVLLSKNFNVRFGYNFLRRNELGFEEKRGMAGMGLGLGFKVNRFQFSYAHSVQNTVDGSNHFTVTTNLHDFTKKK